MRRNYFNCPGLLASLFCSNHNNHTISLASLWMLLHRHHHAEKAQERKASMAPIAEWAHVNPICGTKTAHRAQGNSVPVTKSVASEPKRVFEHACNELLWHQGRVPKVACFGLKSGSSRSQGWLFWSQCSVTPPKSVRIAAKKGTYRRTKGGQMHRCICVYAQHPA